eukprot:gb/GEZJ01009174.1/.p1 GENE.gb/GEZJ01009174.1/~~gb/GEZJ01009174.1/.p1  ORF type:complete len:108 (-),score=4.21 gb/GEZJ01009174.1/:150-473(-)
MGMVAAESSKVFARPINDERVTDAFSESAFDEIVIMARCGRVRLANDGLSLGWPQAWSPRVRLGDLRRVEDAFGSRHGARPKETPIDRGTLNALIQFSRRERCLWQA